MAKKTDIFVMLQLQSLTLQGEKITCDLSLQACLFGINYKYITKSNVTTVRVLYELRNEEN